MSFLIPIRLWLTTHPKHAMTIFGLIAALIVVLAIYAKGRHDAHAKDEARQKIAVAEAIKRDTHAAQKSSETLTRDALVIAAKEKELTDAVANVTDEVPDAVAVAAGCVELRQHGISTADLPACQPAGGGTVAGSRR